MKFENLIVVQSRLSLLYQPIIEIRKSIFDLEDALKEDFLTPQLLALPDDAPAEIARIQFQSKNGHSVLQFAPIRTDLITTYDKNFNSDSQKCFDYIATKGQTLSKSLAILKPDVAVTGLAITVRWPQTESSDEEMVKWLHTRFYGDCLRTSDHEDVRVVYTNRRKGKYFVAVNMGNYRLFASETTLSGPYPRLGKLRKIQHGVEMEIEINDKLGYNNGEVSKGLDQVGEYLSVLGEVIKQPLCLG